jgi:hypothetical protein
MFSPFARDFSDSRMKSVIHPRSLAPAVGFEPTTNRLTADRSTTELRWIKFFGRTAGIQFAHRIASGKCFQIFDIDLVAGAGFEPAVPQTRDYEPDRGRSIIL